MTTTVCGLSGRIDDLGVVDVATSIPKRKKTIVCPRCGKVLDVFFWAYGKKHFIPYVNKHTKPEKKLVTSKRVTLGKYQDCLDLGNLREIEMEDLDVPLGLGARVNFKSYAKTPQRFSLVLYDESLIELATKLWEFYLDTYGADAMGEFEKFVTAMRKERKR